MFDYGAWWRTMKNVGEPADDVYAHEYTPDFVAIKYDGARGGAKPFKHRGMQARRLASDDPLVASNPVFYRHGAYVLFEASEGTEEREQKNVCIVDVQKKAYEIFDESGNLVEATNVFVADHFSFRVSTNDDRSGRRLKFHRTEYVPDGPGVGWRKQIDNFLPTVFDMGAGREAFARQWLVPQMLRHAKVIHDMLAIDRDRPAVIEGGAAKRTRRQRRAIGDKTFESLFKSLPLKRIIVISIPSAQQARHDVTIIVEDRLTPRACKLKPSYFAIGVPSDIVANEESLRGVVAGVMRDNFVSIPDP